jgi:hypothetical protein
MSLVCTLAIGALRRFWVKSSDIIEKSQKLGKLHNQIRIVSISHLMHFVIINVISIHY